MCDQKKRQRIDAQQQDSNLEFSVVDHSFSGLWHIIMKWKTYVPKLVHHGLASFSGDNYGDGGDVVCVVALETL